MFRRAVVVLLLTACGRSATSDDETFPRRRPASTSVANGGDAMPNAVLVTPVTKEENPYFEFQVTRQVEPIGMPVSPQYPVSLRSAGVSGEVLIQFVVDTTGHVETRGVRILRSSDDLFSLAAREVLPRLRFRPAELEGRKVRQVVQQPFSFSVTR